MIRRVLLAAIGATIMFQPAYADTRNDVIQGILRCGQIQDDRAWLNCTYGAQQPMRAKLGLTPAPNLQQRLVPPPSYARANQPPPAASYVAPLPVSGRPATMPVAVPAYAPTHREASLMQILSGNAPALAASTVADIKFDSQNQFIVTLQNGEVWHQLNAQAHHAQIKPGDRGVVREGALWSYNLEINDKAGYKVERRK